MENIIFFAAALWVALPLAVITATHLTREAQGETTQFEQGKYTVPMALVNIIVCDECDGGASFILRKSGLCVCADCLAKLPGYTGYRSVGDDTALTPGEYFSELNEAYEPAYPRSYDVVACTCGWVHYNDGICILCGAVLDGQPTADELVDLEELARIEAEEKALADWVTSLTQDITDGWTMEALPYEGMDQFTDRRAAQLERLAQLQKGGYYYRKGEQKRNSKADRRREKAMDRARTTKYLAIELATTDID